MNISEIKKLEKEVGDKDYNTSYKSLYHILYILSFIGHGVSIFLGYFYTSSIFADTLGNATISFVLSLVLLSVLEILKRDFFSKSTLDFIKHKTLRKENMGLAIFSLFFIALTFYITIHGSREFTNKGELIEQDTDKLIGEYKDSITNAFSLKIQPIDSTISSINQKINIKDDEIGEISKSLVSGERTSLTASQRERTRVLNDDKKDLYSQISIYKNEIKTLETERNNTIDIGTNKLLNNKDKLVTKNESGVFKFMIVSALIEILIVGGICFCNFYKYKSYIDGIFKIESNPMYPKWKLYNDILEIIHTEKMANNKLPSQKSLIAQCKMEGLMVLPKEMTEFIKTLVVTGIIKSSGASKVLAMDKDKSTATLMEYFKIS